jgi:hypothetical protein
MPNLFNFTQLFQVKLKMAFKKANYGMILKFSLSNEHV